MENVAQSSRQIVTQTQKMEKKRDRKAKKIRFKSKLSYSSYQSYSLVHFALLSVSDIAPVQYLIPSSSHPLFLLVCFSPPSITLMKKKKNRSEPSEESPRGRRMLAKADPGRWRGTESKEHRKIERKYDIMFPFNASRQDSCIVQKELEIFLRHKGGGGGSQWRFIVWSPPLKFKACINTCDPQP